LRLLWYAVILKNVHETAYQPPGGQALRAAAGGVSQAKNRVFLLGDLHTSNGAKRSFKCDMVLEITRLHIDIGMKQGIKQVAQAFQV
jgi:hypothetical protein